MANHKIAPLITEMKSGINKSLLYGLKRAEGTLKISSEIKNICQKMKYRCIPEYPAGKINSRYSYIDFVCTQRSGIGKSFNIAIEIDSSNKQLSIEKLLEMNNRGFQCVWIRWNCQLAVHPPEEISLIDLT